ncbi:putative Xre family DNA-binding protein [Gordonia hirsuta DSM 44140 = NBRC 16056]|uniref:Putative Xre family DNA-binding protein n=1 Tax=Gordonia hirsuta DSM 44140 = NBRC 16056 TaxID=1121927 RepID=L7LBD3_9ACTN|nr:helix-turn-helix transcriptional regulator [Gordonia hirsuta]GAC58234.1 putative Xre family DNA-binding protein [Gordonia hirsuta DSM 44140 = NBRC 16056]
MAESERGSLAWDTYAYSFAHRLLIIRKKRGYSQEELAERCGLHRNAVSNLERATSNRPPHISDPQLSTVYRLARALEVPPALLLPEVSVKLPSRSKEQATVNALSAVETELHRLLADDVEA